MKSHPKGWEVLSNVAEKNGTAPYKLVCFAQSASGVVERYKLAMVMWLSGQALRNLESATGTPSA